MSPGLRAEARAQKRRSAARRPERRVEVVETGRPGPRSRRQAQQVRRAGRARSFDRGAVLDQAFDAAERGGALPKLHPRRGRDRRGLAARDPDRQHDAEAALHLPRRDRVARVARQARIEHAGDVRVPASRSASVGRLAPEPRARAEAACACRASAGRPRTGPRMAPWPRADARDARPERVGPRASPARRRPRRNGRSGFCGGMHDDVGAERQRARDAPARPRSSRRRAAAPAACAISAAAAMSVTVQSGFAGVSIQTSLVPPGRTARAHGVEIGRVDEGRPSSPSARLRSSASCAAPSTSPSARRRGRRARAPGTARSPPPCRRRRAAPPAASSSMAMTLSACAHRGVVGPAVDEARGIGVVGIADDRSSRHGSAARWPW